MTLFIVRKVIQSDNPQEQGPAIDQFQTYEEAQEFSQKLWREDKVKSYVSEEDNHQSHEDSHIKLTQ